MLTTQVIFRRLRIHYRTMRTPVQQIVSVIGRTKCRSADRGSAVKKKNYHTNKRRYALLPCPSVLKMNATLADIFETKLKSDMLLTFEDEDGFLCRHRSLLDKEILTSPSIQCTGVKNVACDNNIVEMTLFTLNHSSHLVGCVTWKCTVCGNWNLYSGENHGIFPTRKRYAYTVELLYSWIVMSCLYMYLLEGRIALLGVYKRLKVT